MTSTVDQTHIKLLLVDDDPALIHMFSATLTLLGRRAGIALELQTATDGSMGLQRAEEFRPDVLLVDVNMPLRNGIEVTRLVCAEPDRYGPVMVLVMSGWAELPNLEEQARAAGALEVWTKPVLPSVVINYLAREWAAWQQQLVPAGDDV